MVATSKSVVGLKADSLDLRGGSKVYKGGQAISAIEDSQVASRVRIFDIFATKNSLNKVDMICGLVKYGKEVVLFRPRSL